ncbi:lysine-epsilon-oxidase maturase LodB [Pseudoalteromonas luteoviolacea]|uniref:lysine-epsilon-oxidase maturase LodB n=1 Tax=Pseudoalteromonas luteoviolacea TaxID=43657 RepID=UPI001F2BA68B|nr:lysine-epsilon-oxidase maturase LodB [Pseudoalteromonas luteoviolacea]MCF6439532.1 lysine-epsilon-oxidase maturase LodB [Pseudoalteromonas luteoviolacea]
MMQAHECDVLVVGAGPSGASTALNLLNHTALSVVIIEQSDLQRLRVGESVSESIFSLLTYLNIPESEFGPNCFVSTQGNTAYWGSDKSANRHAIFAPDRATYQINRDMFDATLLEQVVRRGGSVFPRTKSKEVKKRQDGRYLVEANHPKFGKLSITCRYLVDASGRNSSLSKVLGASLSQYDRLTGVGAFFKARQQSFEQLQLIESDEFGWWYSAALSRDFIVVTYFADFERISKHKLNRFGDWRAYLGKSLYMSKRVEGATCVNDNVWVRPAGTHFNRFMDINNYLPVGDAACAFDPISSMGLGFAMTSGCQAASIIGNSLTSTDFERRRTIYQQDLEQQFAQYLTLKQQFYSKEQRWPNSPFWSRRQQQVENVA